MYVYGKNGVKEFLKKSKKIYKAYLYHNFNDENIILALQKRKISIKYLSKFELNQIVKENHQGIILSIPDFHYAIFDEVINNLSETSFLVILDHLVDPHNFGAILRTCEAAGIDAVIIPKNRSVKVTNTVIKISSGAVNYIPICRVANINQIIRKLKKKNFQIIGADSKTNNYYSKIDYQLPIALVIGNEGQGLHKLTKDLCDVLVKIPLKGCIESLNASVASGILIYKINENRGE
ncbi:MAG: 23S rRNA (guanosine(2251)-2'-O)-methyltransferase RlmB [Bacilli bacterium]|jgi:23S rRNA (guanosine2251-2'-O)-methyltransferase